MKNEEKMVGVETYLQVSEVLFLISEFHRQCSELYTVLSGKAGEKMVRLLFDCMAGRERQMGENLERYRNQAPREIMDLWIQFALLPQMDEAAIIDKFTGHSDISSAVKLGQSLDERLMSNCRFLAENAESMDVRDLFAGLLVLARRDRDLWKEDEAAVRNHHV